MAPKSDRTQIAWLHGEKHYSLKYGPFGWLPGQTMMKMMLSKVLAGNLHGLADKVRSNAADAA